MWARNGRWILTEMPDFHVTFRNLVHAVNLRHGTDGFTSPPKEGVLRISSAGFEPANLGTKGQHATSRPPKPLGILLHTCPSFLSLPPRRPLYILQQYDDVNPHMSSHLIQIFNGYLEERKISLCQIAFTPTPNPNLESLLYFCLWKCHVTMCFTNLGNPHEKSDDMSFTRVCGVPYY